MRRSAGHTDIFLFTWWTTLALHIPGAPGRQAPGQFRQIQQVFCPEQRPAIRDRHKRIDIDDVGPTGRKRNQLMFVVVEEDPILTPGTLVRDQFERVAPPRVERVSDLKNSCRNVGLRCSC